MIGVRWLIKDAEAQAALKKAAKKMEKPEGALKQIGGVLLRSIAKTFDAGGRPTRWKPSIRVEQTGGKTLLKTARLLRSITMKVTGRSLTVGTNVVYARIHQLGGVIKPKSGKALKINIPGVGWRTMKQVTIPARPFLVVQDEDIRVFNRILAEDVTS